MLLLRVSLKLFYHSIAFSDMTKISKNLIVTGDFEGNIIIWDLTKESMMINWKNKYKYYN